MNVAAWLRELGLGEYIQAFQDNDVDGETLRRLTERDLAEIGVKSIGHRRKLWAEIGRLGDPSESDEPIQGGGLPTQAEHRQISVLYCDMVGSTALSGRLDPEDYREVIRSFHDACTRTLAAHEGFVANFIGDCLLAYFGWPRAHENDAERAVRAASALIKAVDELHARSAQAVAVRVSIATGVVVIGDLVREGPAQEQSALGRAPYLAAELQTLTLPGQIVIDEATRRLLGSSYAVRSQGSLVPSGASEAVAAWLVVGPRTVDSRFDALTGNNLAPLVGRDQELALLRERWAQASCGEGQAVLLVGEAGIGKSRIARALLDACAGQPHEIVRWQCSPYYTGSALWPVIQRLERAAELAEHDSADQVLDKLEALTGRAGEAAALYATLLGLNGAQRYGPLEMAPQMLRERTLELLAEQLFERTERSPLLLVVEDAHWIDPTTLELIDRCLGKINTERMLMLITSRPDRQPALAEYPGVTQLWLNRLGRTGVQAIAARLAGDALPPETLASIVAQSDGVPLFVEELTKAVLETGDAAIPASLHGSLMARLDRLPEVKEVAQIAACIGRDFDAGLLQALVSRPDAVPAALDKLSSAELIYRRGDRAQARYTFKHALLQEAAYESLLRARRHDIHARILQLLEAQTLSTPSEILAHHAQRAGQADKAIAYWSQAGTTALGKSAYAEAAGCLGSAIELLRAQPESRERRSRELELQLRLGLAYMAFLGFPAQATRAALLRADELLDADQDHTHYYPVQYGLWAGHMSRAEFDQGLRLAQRTLVTAQSDGTDQALLFAHRIVATSHMYLGEFQSVRPHFDQALRFFDPNRQRGALAKQFSVDPGAAVHCCYGFSLAILGHAAQSRAMLERGREVGSTLEQASARAYTFYQLAITGAVQRDPAYAKANAEIVADLAVKHRLPMYLGTAQILLGWATLESGGPAEEAISYHERGLAELAKMNSHVYVPIYLAWQATALLAAGRHADAQHTMTLATAENEAHPQGWGDAELWRLRGELLLHGPQRNLDAAAACFESALSVARARSAKLWELRAAVSLARLWVDQGRHAETVALLGPICGWFTEGLDSIDLVEARELLSAARSPGKP